MGYIYTYSCTCLPSLENNYDTNISAFCSVSDNQLKLLSSTKLPLLFATLELFVGWVKEGLYDFSSLPMALKVQLSEDDLATLEKLPAKYPGTPSKLLRELKGLVEVLLHIETHLVKEVNQIAQVSDKFNDREIS